MTATHTVNRENAIRRLLTALFPEEFDYVYDSILEAKERRRGKNPMSPEYQLKINNKRADFRVPPLTTSGEAQDNTSERLCREMTQGVCSAKLDDLCTMVENYAASSKEITLNEVVEIITTYKEDLC